MANEWDTIDDDEGDVIAPMDAIKRLDRDLRNAATTLQPSEARYLVALYYEMQEQRIRAAAQFREAGKREEPNALVTWMMNNYYTLEGDIKRAMDAYSTSRPDGSWLRAQVGIGPVLAAGLMAHVDITRSVSPSHIWSFAGLNPQAEWLGAKKANDLIREIGHGRPLTFAVVQEIAQAAGRATPTQMTALWTAADGADDPQATVTAQKLAAALAKRPWNADLKVLCWKIGQSFVKSSGNPRSYYGPVYVARKEYELRNNNLEVVPGVEPRQYRLIEPGKPGLYAPQAARILQEKKIGLETQARGWYEQGILPPAHIQARAERYTVKLCLAHYWSVLYDVTYGADNPNKPRPYAIEHLGHVDYLPPPNWPH